MRRHRIVSTIALAAAIGGISTVVPAAGQDSAYLTALESGDLSALVPEAFADAEIIAGIPFDASLSPPQVDTPDAAAARQELLTMISEAGLTPADVTTLGGFFGDDTTLASFGATRIPGVPAGDWFESLYRVSMFRNYADPIREIVAVGPKQVLRIADRGSNRSDLLYAQGEVLWTLSGDDALGLAFIEALETIEGPALQADPGAPREGETVVVIGTPDDPLSQIPAEINGAATTTQTILASTVFDNVDPGNEEAVALANGFRALLDAVGGVDRATIVSSQARGADGDGIIILGLNVDGADQRDFRDGFVDLFLLSQLDEPQFEETQLGGKRVTRISEAGSLSGDVAYVYGVGETVWILRGQDQYITALLRTMP
jgi:hypothetical protein